MSNSIKDSLQNARDNINNVIINYVNLMQLVGISIEVGNNNVEINKRKFLEIKKELYNFIVKHKNIFEVGELTSKIEHKEWPLTADVETFEEFINIEDFLKNTSEIIKIYQTYPNADDFGVYVDNLFVDDELEKSIKNVLGFRKCRKLHSEDIKKFFDNNFLVDK